MRKKAKPSLKNLKVFLDHMLCFFWEILTSLMYTREGYRQARRFPEDVSANCFTQVLDKVGSYTP